MCYYSRIDFYKGIDDNKTNESRKWIICNYRYFLKVKFELQSSIFNGCHDLMQKAVGLNYSTIVFAKEN